MALSFDIAQHCSAEMATDRAKNKVNLNPRNRNVTSRRQAEWFRLAQIDDQRNGGLRQGRGAQNSYGPRLNQPVQDRRAAGDGQPVFDADFSSVIGHQIGTERHQLQGQR